MGSFLFAFNKMNGVLNVFVYAGGQKEVRAGLLGRDSQEKVSDKELEGIIKKIVKNYADSTMMIQVPRFPET